MGVLTNAMSHVRAYSKRSSFASRVLDQVDGARFPETRPARRALAAADELIRFLGGSRFLRDTGTEILVSEGATWLRRRLGPWYVLDHSTWPLLTSDFERREFHEMARHVPDHGLVYDVGANFGLHTVEFAVSNRNIKVEAFEPAPEAAALLRRNLAKNEAPNVSVNQLALADCGGELDVTTEFGTGNRIYRPSRDTIAPKLTRVRSVRLDDFWAERGSPNVHLVKIDVEGAEPLVLEGARTVLGKCRPVVFIELADVWLRRYGSSKAACIDRLRELGYRFVLPFGRGREARWTDLPAAEASEATNYLFASTDPRSGL